MKKPVAIAIGLLLCVALAHGQAAAQQTSVPLGQALHGEAKAEYEAARQLVDDNDYTGALAKFRHVYELSADPRLLWDMAACEKELRHYARAASLIDSYLQQGGKRITPDARRDATDTRLALSRLYSPVTLGNTTASARIFVDGVAVERTQPTAPILVDLGTHQLRVEQSGLKTYEAQIEVLGQKELRIDVPAEKEELPSAAPDPRLSITTTEAQETVAIDGKVLASGRWQGTVAPGTHTVRVTAAGKKPFEAQLDLLPGSTRSLQVALTDEGSNRPLWPWITGGVVVAAGAALGAYFLFKPDDTPGAQPTGRLGSVQLPLGSSFR